MKLCNVQVLLLIALTSRCSAFSTTNSRSSYVLLPPLPSNLRKDDFDLDDPDDIEEMMKLPKGYRPNWDHNMSSTDKIFDKQERTFYNSNVNVNNRAEKRVKQAQQKARHAPGFFQNHTHDTGWDKYNIGKNKSRKNNFSSEEKQERKGWRSFFQKGDFIEAEIVTDNNDFEQVQESERGFYISSEGSSSGGRYVPNSIPSETISERVYNTPEANADNNKNDNMSSANGPAEVRRSTNINQNEPQQQAHSAKVNFDSEENRKAIDEYYYNKQRGATNSKLTSSIERLKALWSRIKPTNVQEYIIFANIALFVVQVLSAVAYTPTLNHYMRLSTGRASRITKMQILEKTLWGAKPFGVFYGNRFRTHSMGPFTADFFHHPVLSKLQPHRFLTSGFLHWSATHLAISTVAFKQVPQWVAGGVGTSMYLATFLMSVVTGNMLHSLEHAGSNIVSVGATGGIAGLCGMMFTVLKRMGRENEAPMITRNMLLLAAYGVINPRVSNMAHIGGFAGGALMGFLFGPSFRRSWISKRSRWFSSNSKLPMKKGIEEAPSLLPIKWFFYAALLLILTKEQFRAIPTAIISGLTNPGSLSGVRFR